jgi:hypothetical protein
MAEVQIRVAKVCLVAFCKLPRRREKVPLFQQSADILPGPAWLVGSGWPPLIGGATGWIALAVTAALLFRRR